ncbi:MAG TPA: copper-binding protein [Oxalicibacterium sp.]
MKSFAVFTTTLIALVTSNAFAQQPVSKMDMGSMTMGAPSNARPGYAPNTGEIKAINKERQMITLNHGEIKSKTVKMSPMTMSFPVANASTLSHLKVGDHVQFTVENIKGQATITELSEKR